MFDVKRSLFLVALFAMIVFSLGGCSDTNSTECGSKANCGDGETCLNGFCVQVCTEPASCPGSDDGCQKRTCNSGVCGMSYKPAATALNSQVSGDCRKEVCDGSGSVRSDVDDSDVPSSQACRVARCDNGTAKQDLAPQGTACGEGGSLSCDDTGLCVGCHGAEDCEVPAAVCVHATCVASSCGTVNEGAGTPVEDLEGNCQKAQCDGNGSVETVDDQNDVPADDGRECTVETCEDGNPVHAPKPAGTACSEDGGAFCNSSGACVQACHIAGSSILAGDANPANSCEVCALANLDAWSAAADGTSCGQDGGVVCKGRACVADCYIDGAFYAAGIENPDNACEKCAPAVNATAWSAAADGISCSQNGGAICKGRACVAECYIDGAFHAAGIENPDNACEKCDPAANATSWSAAADGASCSEDAGFFCYARMCHYGCLIDGVFRVDGTVNQPSHCTRCIAEVNSIAWSPAPIWVECNQTGGNFCDGAGTCVKTCNIAGETLFDGTINPNNSCQICNAWVNTTSWSAAVDGSACSTGGGTVCESGVCVSP